jgi:hypothetical protein
VSQPLPNYLDWIIPTRPKRNPRAINILPGSPVGVIVLSSISRISVRRAKGGITDRRSLRVALAGGLGGAVNATLCYFEWPTGISNADFHWHIIPTGFLHGSVLALLAFVAGVNARQLKALKRWALALPVGWLAGYIAWIPLHMSAFDRPASSALMWPIADTEGWFAVIVSPIAYLGGVAVLLYLWVVERPRRSVLANVMASSVAGMLGSLWFWIIFETWYLSLVHGLIWGSLVGLALASDSVSASEPLAAEQAAMQLTKPG